MTEDRARAPRFATRVSEVRANTLEHEEAAHEVITAELVACTLGQRRRLELRVDPAGRLLHEVRQLGRKFAEAFRSLPAEVQDMARAAAVRDRQAPVHQARGVTQLHTGGLINRQH